MLTQRIVMTNVRANCRERFSANDLDFVAKAVSGQSSVISPQLPGDPSHRPPITNHSSDSLAELLKEPEALDVAIESDKLLKALLESPGNIPVTPQFYFYVLTRHMLMRFDRSVADYVASVLAGFANVVSSEGHAPSWLHSERTRQSASLPTPYITDMLISLKSASSEKEFMIRVQVGDYSLFLSGIFPQHIAHRSKHKAAPPLSFYEEVGSQNYRRASDHRLAREQSLVDTYRTIADRFSEVRVGLNQMSDRLLCLEGMG